MKYPRSSEFTLIAILIAGLFVWLFNSYRVGKFSKQNTHYRLWIIGGVLSTIVVLGFSIMYLSNKF